MSYSATTWTEGVTDVGPTNLNHLEQGVQATATVADAAIPAPIGPASNAGLVWNGSSWVAAKIVDANVSATAAIAYSKLSLAGSVVNNDVSNSAAIAYSKLSLATSILNSDVAAAAAIIASKLQWGAGTSPPGSPSTGDLWFYEDVANGIYWLLRYNSAQTTYKWECVGGSPLQQCDTSGSSRQNSSDNTWQNIAGVSSVTLARAGEYLVRFGCGNIEVTSSANDVSLNVSVNGATPTVPALRRLGGLGTGSSPDYVPGGCIERVFTFTAGQTCAVQTISNAHTSVAFFGPFLSITPVRII